MALWSNMRFSLRILRKHWKLTSIAVFSLAVAMAAGATGFSVFNAVAAPTCRSSARTAGGDLYFNADGRVQRCLVRRLRDNNHVFSGVFAFPYSIWSSPVVFNHRIKLGLINTVSDNYFFVLGVQPIVRRLFARGDDEKPSAMAVLSYPYWKSLGADPDIAGKTLTVNTVPLTIVGVTPKTFVGTSATCRTSGIPFPWTR